MPARIVELPSEYRGKFIAYRLSGLRVEIIDSDIDFEKLLEKLRRKGVDPRRVLIDYVPEDEVVYLI